MLKTIELSDKPAPSKNNGNKLVSSKNNNSRLAFKKNNGDSEVNGFCVGGDSMKLAKKSERFKGQKLSKSRKLKGKKSAKSKKKSSKSGNSPNFDTKKKGSSFWTPKTRVDLNCLRLAFIKAQFFNNLIWNVTFRLKLMY